MSLLDDIPEDLQPAMRRRVAVFGYGSAGHAVAQLLKRLGRVPCFYDEKVGDSSDVLRDFGEQRAAEHDLIIHSLAFAADHPWLRLARERGIRVISELEFAQHFRTGKTLVVVGTNGKTTLQEFITFALKRLGQGAIAVGPGKSPMSRMVVHPELDGVTAVCELSPDHSSHLQKFNFDALFWTNFHEDHLEQVEARREAFSALGRLLELSSGPLYYLGDSVIATSVQVGYPLPAAVKTLRPQDYPDWDLADGSAFATVIHRPTLALFRRYWLEHGYTDSLLRSAAEHFEVRAHRLHRVARFGEVSFWNDAKAANFAATCAAINNFGEPVVWIGGGVYRGGNLERFVHNFHDSLKGAVLMGDVADDLRSLLSDLGVQSICCSDLKEAVELAYTLTLGKGPVVYSPGFVVGQMYANIIERGICFENAVLGLKHRIASA